MCALEGFVDHFDGHTIRGWAADLEDPSRNLGVDIFLDGILVATVPAEDYREDLAILNPATAHKGFVYTLPSELSPPLSGFDISRFPKITARISGTDIPLLTVVDPPGLINAELINSAETLCTRADNRFLPTPPQKMIDHVAGEGTTPSSYRAVGNFIVLDLLHYGLVTVDEGNIADVGCGCGRVATHLAPIMSSGGEYHGFDTWAKGIRWAKRHISSRYPNFNFSRLGASENRRDPGYVGQKAFPLGLEYESCDLVLATSLFTHLSYDAAEEYLRQFHRVLTKHGRVYITLFMYDEESRQTLEGKELEFDRYGAYFKHPTFFDSFFNPATITRLLDQTGFSILLRRNGYWRGDEYRRGRRFGFQDLLILKKIQDHRQCV